MAKSKLSAFMRKAETRRSGVLIPLVERRMHAEQTAVAHGKLSRHTIREEELRLQKKATDEFLGQYKKSDSARDHDNKLHPSSAFACRRATWLKIKGAPRNPPVLAEDVLRSQLIFSLGDSVHLRWQILLDRYGILEQWEVPIEVPELDLVGHCDGIIEIDGERLALEIKSINDRGFKALREGPKEEHRFQVNLYMHALGLSRAVILYENKNTSETKEFVVTFSKKMLRQFKETRDVIRESLDTDTPPEKEGDHAGCTVCRWCDFSRVCHEDRLFKEFRNKEKGNTSEGKKKAPSSARSKVKAKKAAHTARRKGGMRVKRKR